MKLTDWIQIAGIIASTIISISSIIIAVKSLKLTQKSIEDANRPYITCFISAIDTGFLAKYFIIKNFGKTSARIINIEFNKELTELGRNGSIDSIINTTIVPNQKFMTVVPSQMNDIIDVTITYEDSNKKLFKETYTINFGYSKDLVYKVVNQSGLDSTANTMQNTAQSLIKHLM
ncbi:hypothetical protein [Bacillus cereus]|uniref:hypothetical protein n=1 Tax=Bacillus cereus TaxID=1396 RepID=UPI000BEDD352|nr:hypothetical protein [Bacillus cereus]MCU4809604.1 hypothetical protein [Bacillus cereus]PEF16529.1 hypothetical protein CON87_23575 [Bacillus cereus]PET09921.1 hypothetical protein CN516_18200 [Bacillus cereus]PEV88306.1 hypothetical protein CN433_16695 [Bacillus cereus]PFP46271.1 hypothetical protein COJ98_23545 [Bacillus cereus]